MKVSTANSLISQLTLKPDWRIETWQNYRFEDSLTMQVSYPAFNYNRENASQGYEHYPIEASASFNLMVGDIDEDVDLYLMVMSKLMEIEQHEWREALRVAPTFWAPFHPHRMDGMKRWGSPDYDYSFGLA